MGAGFRAELRVAWSRVGRGAEGMRIGKPKANWVALVCLAEQGLEDRQSVGFENVAGLILGELAVAATLLQVVNEVLAKLAAVFLVAGHGAKDFEHFLGEVDFPLAALLSVNQKLAFDFVADGVAEAGNVGDEIATFAVLACA